MLALFKYMGVASAQTGAMSRASKLACAHSHIPNTDLCDATLVMDQKTAETN